MSERVFVSSFFLVAGIVCLYFIERKIAHDRRFAASAKPATGQVVDTWVDTGGDSAIRGVTVKFTVALDLQIWVYLGGSERVGDNVDVIYDPEDPWDARRKGKVNLSGRFIVYGWMLLWLGCSSMAINGCLARRNGAGA